MKLKIKAHQRAILAETAVYAFGRRLKAMNREERLKEGEQYLEPFPLYKMYARYKRADRRIILMGINIWFERVREGDGLSKKCSGWKVRDHARLDPQILQFFRTMYNTNIEHIKLLKASINAKDKKVVDVTSMFIFKCEDEAQMFVEIVEPLLNEPELTTKETL